jgi:hypothetical protein
VTGPVRPPPPPGGNAAGLPPRQPDLVGELVAVLEGVLDHYVDVNVGFESVVERELLDRAAAVLDRVRREGRRP